MHKASPPSERLLDVTDLTARWGVSRRTIERLVKGRRLAAIKIGRQTRFRLEDVLAYEKRGRT